MGELEQSGEVPKTLVDRASDWIAAHPVSAILIPVLPGLLLAQGMSGKDFPFGSVLIVMFCWPMVLSAIWKQPLDGTNRTRTVLRVFGMVVATLVAALLVWYWFPTTTTEVSGRPATPLHEKPAVNVALEDKDDIAKRVEERIARATPTSLLAPTPEGADDRSRPFFVITQKGFGNTTLGPPDRLAVVMTNNGGRKATGVVFRSSLVTHAGCTNRLDEHARDQNHEAGEILAQKILTFDSCLAFVQGNAPSPDVARNQRRRPGWRHDSSD